MSKHRLFGLVAVLVSTLGAVACSASPDTGEEVADDVESAQKKGSGGGSKIGNACTATTTQGKTYSGTYTNDVDGINCAGSWGSVACTDADGKSNGKCKDKATIRRPTGSGAASDTTATLAAP
jgi:hypothetical protein